MEDLERPGRNRSAKWLAGMWLACPLLATAQIDDPALRWQVKFPAGNPLRATESAASPIGEDLLVAVIAIGADAARPSLQLGNRTVASQLAGYDPVSRLGFLRTSESVSNSVEWLDSCGMTTGGVFTAMSASGPIKCRGMGWVKQVGGKVLPFALVGVNFETTPPLPGTPLLDPGGKVAALFFQTGAGKTGYAIPAEAVQRVKRDMISTGRLQRGWLGLSLKAENPAPQIVRILPNSPAAAAGISPGDLLLQVGSRQISDYADAANAFFYLIPGEPVKLKLQRGTSQLEYLLRPTRPVE